MCECVVCANKIEACVTVCLVERKRERGERGERERER